MKQLVTYHLSPNMFDFEGAPTPVPPPRSCWRQAHSDQQQQQQRLLHLQLQEIVAARLDPAAPNRSHLASHRPQAPPPSPSVAHRRQAQQTVLLLARPPTSQPQVMSPRLATGQQFVSAQQQERAITPRRSRFPFQDPPPYSDHDEGAAEDTGHRRDSPPPPYSEKTKSVTMVYS